MADNIKNTTYQGTGQTFEETFNQARVGSREYTEATKGLADELARINQLTREERDQLKDWLDGLDDISRRWEAINDYVQDTFEQTDEFSEDLKGIRTFFTEVVRDLQSTRTQATEHVRLLRSVRDLSGDIQRSMETEGGLSKSNLDSLTKRVQKAQDLYNWKVKSLVGDRSISEVRGETSDRIQALTAEKEAIDSEVKRLQAKLQTARQNGAPGFKTFSIKADLDEALQKQRAFNKEKRAELDYWRAVAEILAPQTGQAIEKLNQNLKKTSDQMREIRDSHRGLNLAAKIARKFGVEGTKEDLDEYDAQVKAAQEGQGEMPSQMALLLKWFDPVKLAKLAAIAAARQIWKALKEASSEAAKLNQEVGQMHVRAAAANFEFASSVDWLKTANELVQQFGQDPTSFISPDGIARLAEAKNLLGLSAEQAGNLGIRAKLAGQNSDAYNESIVQGINHGNALNRSAVAHGLAMKEVLATSDDITLSLDNSGERLGRAIVAAKNLGMSLKDVDTIAGTLLNFETSIENELKAQLLTGNQMNLSRARGLALQNDLEGVARELTTQGMTAAKFGELNRIQQESYAAALGMSREQLGRMLVQQAGLAKLTDEQVKAATGVTREQLEAMGITERWKVATDKLAQAFTPLLELVMPVVELLSKIIVGIAGVLGHIFSFLSPGIAAVVKGLGVLVGVVLAAKLAFKGLGWVAGKAFKGIGAGIVKTLRGVGAGINALVSSMGKVATSPHGWLAVAMVAALGGAMWMLGLGVKAAGEGIKAITEGFTGLFRSLVDIDLEKIMAIGPAFLSLGAGLFLAIPGLAVAALTLGPITKQLTKLAAAQPAIQALAGSIVYLASAIGTLKTNINGLETGNLRAIRREAVKAWKAIDSGEIRAAATSRASSPVLQENIQATATAAENSKLEKLVGVIANRVGGILKVEVTNFDYDKFGRQLAVQTVRG